MNEEALKVLLGAILPTPSAAPEELVPEDLAVAVKEPLFQFFEQYRQSVAERLGVDLDDDDIVF